MTFIIFRYVYFLLFLYDVNVLGKYFIQYIYFILGACLFNTFISLQLSFSVNYSTDTLSPFSRGSAVLFYFNNWKLSYFIHDYLSHSRGLCPFYYLLLCLCLSLSLSLSLSLNPSLPLCLCVRSEILGKYCRNVKVKELH